MRNQIVKKEKIASKTYSFWIYHPEIVSHYKPGQFIILRVTEKGERIPLTIVEVDREKEIFRIIFQVVGKSTRLLSKIDENEMILDILGPLGNEVRINKDVANILFVGGGIGIAPLFSKIKEFLKEKKLKGSVILGARSSENLILENEILEITRNIYITTDDGSKGKKGFVTDALRDLLNTNEDIDLVISAGPVKMMKKTVEIAKKNKIDILVSLNTLMIDGTGMCGGCRIEYDNKTRFTCVDGPVFDGYKVNFQQLIKRNNQYHSHECKIKNLEDNL
ncbi:MAG: sulfide/dihydroorotate dehydrogenase-like FAD/NAD-binding protein [Candidatus Mcinerneyibacterium aminivorans]|jgi:ferredoxin--NADP+ reductase|uniref:Sulfide/dihydroorotate dehydrogenase-like FAD/NAD-binding protein n=1 Tax=Candidatus Mcinerneyibacterium aminivorans TaxID=2703815 RepID=A0A5D0MGT6_9BACT|nr:MAG: sulfide/dihydroorotate dehydrogenase-like FAD/NAD-binding protein [Candidatus Mcinerneyibacterium aminivorans]